MPFDKMTINPRDPVGHMYVCRNTQYSDVYRRRIEIPQRTRILRPIAV